MDIGWKLRRASHLARRIAGSIAIRGWRATLRRAFRGRSEARKETLQAPMAILRPPAADGMLRRMLVIESMTPDPTRDSGSMRLCQMFSLLNADGWSIDFFADDDDATPHDVARLATLGVAVHRGNPVRWLRQEGERLDAVMLCRLPIADQYLSLVRQHAPDALVIFDTVDLHFVREQRAAALVGSPQLQRRAARSRRRELAMVARADVTLVVSEEERTILARETPASSVELVSNIHDIVGRSLGFAERSGLLFVGGFGHPPNEDAVRWFIEQVLPGLRAHDASIVFHVVGDIDPEKRCSIERDGVQVYGRVPDLGPLLSRVRLSVAPLRFGAGVKGKVNQAMSHGLPVVLTSIAAEGMHIQTGTDALVADDAKTMAAMILRAYHDEPLWSRLSDGGMENIRQHFSTEHALEALRRATRVERK